MKKKIPTLQTGIPVSTVGNQNKRKEIYSDQPDPNEGNTLSKRKKYVATDAKPHAITTISQVSAIKEKIIKKKEKKIQAASSTSHSYSIEDIPVDDMKENPVTSGAVVISAVQNVAVPSSLPGYFTNLLPMKSEFDSPLPKLIQPRSTSTPVAGSEGQKLYFDLEPVTPMKELIPSSFSNQAYRKCGVIISEPLSQPITSAPKNKTKLMLTSDKLKLGILNTIPKFCPFCDYVCERMINHHIEENHKDQLKLPIPASVDAINKIISNYTKSKKVIVPLHQIIDIMGDYWFNPEIRKIGHILCNLGQIKTYGGSWELNNVPETSNPFEQYMVNI